MMKAGEIDELLEHHELGGLDFKRDHCNRSNH